MTTKTQPPAPAGLVARLRAAVPPAVTVRVQQLIGWARQRPLVASAIAAVVILAVVLMVRGNSGSSGKQEAMPLAKVKRGELIISFTESGTIQNRDKTVVRSGVEGANTILFVVDEGKIVKKGDLLIELDKSRLLEKLQPQQIAVENTGAGLVQATEQLEITRNENQAKIDEAELKLTFARMDLEKGEKGEFPRDLQQCQSKITVAKEELQRDTEKLAWSKRLEAEGFITRTELQADELAVKRRELDLAQANTELQLLQKYTGPRELEKRRSDIHQTELALEREKRKATANLSKAEADLRARQSEDNLQRLKLKKIEDQIEKCRIIAPTDGMVVFAGTANNRPWDGAQPLSVGQDVRERQELIHLPTSAEKVANISVPEANLSRIKVGLTATVTVDALPGRIFKGTINKIGVMPDTANSWLNPDLKLFNCEIALAESDPGLRSGMNCKVEMVVESYPDTLFIPVQCVVRVDDVPTVYVPRRGHPAPVPVKIGLDNNRMVRIISGLKAGESICLAPPLDVGEKSGPPKLPPTPGKEKKEPVAPAAPEDDAKKVEEPKTPAAAGTTTEQGQANGKPPPS